MAATYPSRIGFDKLLPAQITKSYVRVGDLLFSAENRHYIKENGVCIKPGGPDNINELTVTFLVGEIQVEDDAINQVQVAP